MNQPFNVELGIKFIPDIDTVTYDNWSTAFGDYKITDKLLKIIGRTDNQIKFLGHRIELEEIEKAFIKLFKVKNCIASIKEKKQYPHKKIVIFLDKNIGSEDKVKLKLSKILPKYMIPEELKFVKKFIYNRNGKLDRTRY